MPYHTGSKTNMPKKSLATMSDTEYYKEHKKHHTDKHIKAMKALQRLGVDRSKAHSYVKKYVD